MSGAEAQLINCHECEHTSVTPVLKHNQAAHCPRCGFKMTSHRENHTHAVLSFSLTALIFLLFSLPFDFLSFSNSGLSQTIGLLSGLKVLLDNDYLSLAVLVFAAIILLPAVILISLLYLYACQLLNIYNPSSKAVAKLVFLLLPWSMAEIFLISVTVSLIKITAMADVELGLSFYSYLGFTLSMIFAQANVDKHKLFKQFDVVVKHKPLNANLSLQRTWALIATAIILYIPANFLPIMYTRTLGQDEPSTIFGGIVLLWKMGSYPVALIIFVASIFVPVAKLVILIWLNLSVQKGIKGNRERHMFWYRLTEFIGRWSMVDVFVVAILVSLIQLGNLMSILPGPAAMAFCGVVIMTMLAAMTFDTRMIWYQPEE